MDYRPWSKADQDRLPRIRSEGATKAFDDALQSVKPADTTRRTPAVKKHVRIKTPPPLSPDSPVNTLIRRVSNEGHTGSPPPQSPIEGGGTANDPFAQQFADEIVASQSKEALDNTRRNSETISSPAPPAAALVLNPFQSTLATIEPTKGKDEAQKKKEVASDTSNTTSLKPAAALDVDSFTKMLTTGAEPPIALNHGTHVDAQGAVQPDNGDLQKGGQPLATSSNKSPFAAAPGSFTNADGHSSSSDNNTTSSNVRRTNSKGELYIAKSAPPLPRHKHGKSVQATGPQTVSFADFDAVSNNTPNPQGSRDVSGESSSSSLRQLSGSSGIDSVQDAVSNHALGITGRLRAPPPVPTARRTGSLKSQKPRDAETPNIGSGQMQSPSTEPPLSPGISKGSKVAPPPPSRRPGNRSSLPPDQIPSSEIASINSDNGSLAGDSILSTDSSSLRQAGATTSLGSRTSSGSGAATSQMAPPPPPPRRRRGSSKSSVEVAMSGDQPRSSQESTRRASGLSQVSENGSEEKGQQNILADLSALQAEVDALRAASLRKAG